ncbi:MAG: histone deacetylase, partial [Candidatus Sumerlaeaceae bacterium]|nr:histone deacetylase [Candidatus Sumerlaeaceae bacterium]
MKFVYSPRYEVDLGPHVFVTAKYRLIRETLLSRGLVSESDFAEPMPPSREELLSVHTAEYLDDLQNLRWTERTRYSELPLTREIVEAGMLAAGGSILGARIAASQVPHLCVHIGGGFHHAFADRAEGFCYVNDIAVAIRVLQRDGVFRRAMVVDCDLHQGNGTAHIFRDDASVFTLSIHQENNYPLKQKSDCDIGLDDYVGDTEYVGALADAMIPAMDRHKPEFLVYVAGADPYYDDQLGSLRLTKEGLKKRDELVLDEAKKRGIPTLVVMAGGYARKLEDTVAIP